MNSPLVDIGAELRQARESQQRSLDELSHLTLIHIRHLQAVEDGCDVDLPEPFYVKNFIRKYANALGLPGDAMANRYWDTRPLPEQPHRPATAPDIMVPWWVFPAMLGALLLGAIATFAVMNSSRAPAVAQSPGVESTDLQAGTGGASESMFAGATASGGVEAASGSQNGAEPTQEASASAQEASESAAPIAAGSASQEATTAIAAVPSPPVPSPQPTGTPMPANLPPVVVPQREIAFRTFNKEEAWMQIVADGREVHSGVMPKNMVRTWVAARSLSVRIGRPGVVAARLGDRSLGILGPKDAPVYRRTFYTREGFAQQQEAVAEHVARVGNHPATQRTVTPRPKPAARPTHAAPTPVSDTTPEPVDSPAPSESATRNFTVE